VYTSKPEEERQRETDRQRERERERELSNPNVPCSHAIIFCSVFQYQLESNANYLRHTFFRSCNYNNDDLN